MSTEELKRWAARLKEAREKKRCTPEECPVIHKDTGKEIKIDWQFSIQSARTKMNSHYVKVYKDNSKLKEI